MAIMLNKTRPEEGITTPPPLTDDSIRQTAFRQPGDDTRAAPAGTPSPSRFQRCMEFQEAITACFKKYATFTGRATRAEYWWFQLFMSAVQAVSIALVISAYTISGTLGTLAVLFWLLFSLAAIIPCLSVTVRRLHDRGFSGWWLLPATIIITLLPISAIAWLIIMSLPSGPSNKYGDVPCMADSF